MKQIIATALLALTAWTMTSGEKYQYNEYYYQRASLFDILPVGNEDIVFVGNSLTNGGEWHELLNNCHVKNRGIVSDVIQGVADRMGSVTKGEPKKIFIMGGVNDISHHISADSIAIAMENLLVSIQKATPKTKIYLQSLLPINNDFGRYKNLKGKEQVFLDTNMLLEKVAKKLGITWVNLYPHFIDSEGKLKREFTNDGLHLMGPGYAVWRDVIKPYVEE